MKKTLTALLVAAVAGALFVAGPIGAAPDHKNKYGQATDTPGTCDGGSGNTMTLHAPAKLWPPNHKYFEDIYVLADGGAADGTETVTLTTRGVHDQYDADTGVEQNGAGNTMDDITVDDEDAEFVQENDDSSDPQVMAVESNVNDDPASDTVRTDWAARAERSGRDQTGRVYTLTADAEFEDGGTCTGSVTITVPHDMRGGADWK